jgi:hypothetical protein
MVNVDNMSVVDIIDYSNKTTKFNKDNESVITNTIMQKDEDENHFLSHDIEEGKSNHMEATLTKKSSQNLASNEEIKETDDFPHNENQDDIIADNSKLQKYKIK